MLEIGFPESNEYHPFYAGYVRQVPRDVNPLDQLSRQGPVFVDFIQGLTPAQHHYAYAPGKWTIQELVLHLIDTERIFSYRALRFAREDQSPLPGMDENHFAAHAYAHERTMPDLLEEYKAVRAATIALFRGFRPQAYTNIGIANEAPISVRALLYCIAGHELHHLQVIRERYLER